MKTSAAAPPPNRRRPGAPAPKMAPAKAPRTKGTGVAGRWVPKLRAVLARLASLVVRLTVVVAIVAALVAGGLFLHHYVTSSEHFEIQDIRLEGAVRVGRDEILRAAGIAAGANVFEIDPDGAASKIRALPWIRTASVERRLPGQVVVRVQEREAAALVELAGLYLVDAEGRIFKKLGERDPNDLPVLTGLTRQAVLDHPDGASEAIAEAMGLLAEYRDAGLEGRAPLSEVHRDGAAGWSVVLANDGTRVALGGGPYRQKLTRLGRLLTELTRRKLSAQTIFLDNRVRQDRATVQLRLPEAPAPVDPRPAEGPTARTGGGAG